MDHTQDISVGFNGSEQGFFLQMGKTVVHMLGRRKWAETSGVTGTHQEFDMDSVVLKVIPKFCQP